MKNVELQLVLQMMTLNTSTIMSQQHDLTQRHERKRRKRRKTDLKFINSGKLFCIKIFFKKHPNQRINGIVRYGISNNVIKTITEVTVLCKFDTASNH